ncbi:MAG TPA: UPF0149 family protein [Gammaproteobacteria bacterium]|nr:UPF0149 family protein [Gammaproteobacteria bacterium]
MTTADLNLLLDSSLAAECHGALTGLACGGGETRDWRAAMPLQDDATVTPDADKALAALGEETLRTLNDGTMNFAPLLPGDDEPIDQRAAALRLWCRGFLYGFGLAFAPGHSAPLPDEAGEVLGDFSEIARQELAAEDGSEADEAAYTEIVEYVRVGVQLVFEILHPASGPAPVLH